MQKKPFVVGIWGLGKVGLAALQHYHTRAEKIITLDKRDLTSDEQIFFATHGITHYQDPNQRIEFLDAADAIIASPGIDLRPYWKTYESKWLVEIDEFARQWHKKIIAITGSVGKTTVTHLMSSLLQKEQIPTATGGNIGTPTYALLDLQEATTQALLELSSFQLEHATKFVPDYALITNIIPNHLDRHDSYDDYARAKLTMITRQKPNQIALLPLELSATMNRLAITPTGATYYFSTQQNKELMASLPHAAGFFYIHENNIILRTAQNEHILLDSTQLPPITFAINWLTIAALWHLMDLPIAPLIAHAQSSGLPPHRLEPVATINTISFINDSKSTTADATRAAVELLEHRTIILFLGGLSKGVDRAPFVASLRGKVTLIYCFGAEAPQLYEFCRQNNIAAKSCATLQEAFADAVAHAPKHSTILFSPSGSSYDLFAHYEERGEKFKELVHQYAQNH